MFSHTNIALSCSSRPSCGVNSGVCYYICTLLTKTFPLKHQVDLSGVVVIISCRSTSLVGYVYLKWAYLSLKMVILLMATFLSGKGGNFIYHMMHRFILYYQASEGT